jgi:hypothetical protein
MEQQRVRYVNRYRLIYKPEQHSSMKSANWNGWIYEHIYVAEKAIGRHLRNNEVVHHLDFDRSNNNTKNLLVLEKGQHAKLHNWLDEGAPGWRQPGANRMNSGKPKLNKFCLVCESTLQRSQKKYCSANCSSIGGIFTERPSKTQLDADIKSMTWLAMGKKYNVSDNAVRKWARQYKLI